MVASLDHFVADASFEDLKSRVLQLRPGGLHIATHVDPNSGPSFMFREPAAAPVMGLSQSSPAAAAGAGSPEVLVGDPSPHVPVPFQDVVDFLRPFGATKPGGFLEYVWINACHTDTLVDQLQRECGVPFVFGWSTKASDSACVEFVRAFYLGLVRYGFTYLRAFDFARDEFARLGYVMDDPSRYEATCITHDAGNADGSCRWSCRMVYKHNGRLHAPSSSRHQGYKPPVVHGVPVMHHDKEYCALYHGQSRIVFPRRSGASAVDGDSCASDVPLPLALPPVPAPATSAGTPSSGPGAAASPGSATPLHSVEVKLHGDVFECGLAVKVVSWLDARSLPYELIDARPSHKLTGESVVFLKVYSDVAETLHRLCDTLFRDVLQPMLAEAVKAVAINATTTCVRQRDILRKCRIKQATLVQPATSVPKLFSRFIRFTGHLWNSGFIMEILFQKMFNDSRYSSHLRVPASTCQFGLSPALPSSLVLQISCAAADDSDFIVQMLRVATTGFVARNPGAKVRVEMSETAFPVPDPTKRSNNWPTRMVLDVSGEVFSSGFASKMYDILASTGAECSGPGCPPLDFRVLCFECGAEESCPSALSLLVSADCNSRLCLVQERITSVMESLRASASIDVAFRFLSPRTATAADAAVPGRDDLTAPGSVPATYGPVWRVVRLQGPLWSSGFVHKIMCPLLRQYWRYMRPRAISLCKQGPCAVNIHVFGPSDRVKERIAELVHMAAGCFSAGVGSGTAAPPTGVEGGGDSVTAVEDGARGEVRAVDMYLLSQAATAARKGCNAVCMSGALGDGAGQSCQRAAIVVRDPAHDLTEAVTVREGPDIDADPSASASDRMRLAMDLALLQECESLMLLKWGGTAVEVLVKEDGFEVASDDESTAPVVFDAIKQLLGRSLGSAGVTYALQSSCGAVGQGVPAVPSTGNGAAVGLGLGTLPGAATGGVAGGSSTGGGDTVGAASGRPARSLAAGMGLRGGSDSVPPS